MSTEFEELIYKMQLAQRNFVYEKLVELCRALAAPIIQFHVRALAGRDHVGINHTDGYLNALEDVVRKSCDPTIADDFHKYLSNALNPKDQA